MWLVKSYIAHVYFSFYYTANTCPAGQTRVQHKAAQLKGTNEYRTCRLPANACSAGERKLQACFHSSV